MWLTVACYGSPLVVTAVYLLQTQGAASDSPRDLGHKMVGFAIVISFIYLAAIPASFTACSQRYEILRDHPESRKRSDYVVFVAALIVFLFTSGWLAFVILQVLSD